MLGAILWQGLIWLGILPRQYFPDVGELLATWARLFVDAAFWAALWDTVMSAFLGLVLGVVVGVMIGVMIGRNVYAFHASRFVLEFLRPIPTVALIPAVVLGLGTGLESKLLLVFLAVVFPIIIQTTYGIVDVDPVALDTAKTFHFSWGRRLIQVLLPAAGPFIMTGLRVAAAVSLLVAVSTEIIIGSPGLGQSITLAEQSNDLDRMYALIAMTGLLGIIVNSLVVGLEKKVASWARNPEASA
jgi:ABC-type nitrate/sulfonate/bicarbonate transport system permease component